MKKVTMVIGYTVLHRMENFLLIINFGITPQFDQTYTIYLVHIFS